MVGDWVTVGVNNYVSNCMINMTQNRISCGFLGLGLGFGWGDSFFIKICWLMTLTTPLIDKDSLSTQSFFHQCRLQFQFSEKENSFNFKQSHSVLILESNPVPSLKFTTSLTLPKDSDTPTPLASTLQN